MGEMRWLLLPLLIQTGYRWDHETIGTFVCAQVRNGHFLEPSTRKQGTIPIRKGKWGFLGSLDPSLTRRRFNGCRTCL